MLAKLPGFRLSLLGKDLTPSKSVKDLGVMFALKLDKTRYQSQLAR